jgi:hypothetical protein
MPIRAAVLLALLAARPALADGVAISDPFARILPGARAGAIYLTIDNTGAEEDRLLSLATPIADRAELHSSQANADGLMQMIPLADGIAVPPGASHALASGGDHVMLMGLKDPPAPGESFPLTLTFEKAGQIVVTVAVDNSR